MNNRFKKRVLDKWYLYIAWLVLVVVLSSWLVGLKASPKKNEKIQIFVTGTSCQTSELYKKIDEHKPTYVKQIVLKFTSYDNAAIDDMYLGFGKGSADVLILPENMLNENRCTYDLLRLQESVLNEALPGNTLFYSNEYCYGLRVYDKESNSGWLNSYVNFYREVGAVNYYLVFNKNSLHVGELNDKELRGAIDIVNYLKSL